MIQLKNSNLKFQNYPKGFTLVELLVVIAIIGILSAFLMANFVGVRQRARDAQRKSDIKQIQTALELYRSDRSAYPLTASFPGCGNALTSGTTTYMSRIPCDAGGSAYNGGNYFYSSNGSTYTMAACLENRNDTSIGTTATQPGGGNACPTDWYIVVINP